MVDMTPHDLADAEARIAAILAQMRAVLEPHKGSLGDLWAAMPAAFRAAYGRGVDRTSDHDLMMCHAAIASFDMAE